MFSSSPTRGNALLWIFKDLCTCVHVRMQLGFFMSWACFQFLLGNVFVFQMILFTIALLGTDIKNPTHNFQGFLLEIMTLSFTITMYKSKIGS